MEKGQERKGRKRKKRKGWVRKERRILKGKD